MPDLLKENCVFCKILAGEFSQSPIYKDEFVAAFMDIQPVTQGHLLVIPVDHHPYIEDVPRNISERMMNIGQKVTRALLKSKIKTEGINFFLANGESAGQEVFHSHLHIFPRFKNDGFGLKHPADYSDLPPRSELDEVAAEIRSHLK